MHTRWFFALKSIKKVVFPLFLWAAFLSASQAQSLKHLYCGAADLHWSKMATDSLYQKKADSDEKRWAQGPERLLMGSSFTLPVVVHIVHNNGSENITDAQVLTAIDHLNQAFANTGYYNPQTGVDMSVSFCLARQDPDGNATTGINRVASSLTDLNLATQDLNLKNLTRWDPLRYINIWVVREVCSPTGCSVAGYAYLPAAHGTPIDGVVVEAGYMGSSPANSVVLIHEMGHYLGLYHTFEGGCSNNNCLTDGDHVCDTPPDQTAVPAPCTAVENSCQTDADDVSANNPFRPVAAGGMGDQPDAFQNYMDYSELTCYDQFSAGQRDRVHFFIQGTRSSLLWSPACASPCLQPVVADFSLNAATILVGQTLTLTNHSLYAAGYTWYLDGVVFSHAVDTTLTFPVAGSHQIVLLASSGDPGCLPDADTLLVEVRCPTKAVFSLTASGLNVQATNTSSNAQNWVWSVYTQNGTEIYTTTTPNLNWTFPAAGWYHLCLKAIGALCSDEYCVDIQIFTPGSENCANEIDDDGDGLVDAFDPDCPCHLEQYQAQCPVSCNLVLPPDPTLNMALKWQTDTIGGSASSLVAGDIDGDGEVEIVFQGDHNRIIILDGKTGALERSIATPATGLIETSPILIADADRNGFGEIYLPIVTSPTTQKVYCYGHTGQLRWQSVNLNIPSIADESSHAYLNIADFNADGIPEVYLSYYILNALTGVLLAKGNAANGAQFNDPYSYARVSVAADFLPDPGLELAAGNTVYKVLINNPNGTALNSMTPVVYSAIPQDAFVGFGDFDNDALPEVVSVIGGGDIYVWNPRTLNTLASITQQQDWRGSIPLIVDIDHDCRPEIAIHLEGKIHVYTLNNQQLTLKYQKATTDGSGWTGLTVFDLNQDGRSELIFRDETLLHVMDATNGTDLQVYPVTSLTAFEMPLIVDLDQDGAAEILTNGNGPGGNGAQSSRIMAFESAAKPWAPARKVWNQSCYSVTNINDDLTVPRYPQNPGSILSGTNQCPLATCAAPYNNFLVQATNRTQQGCIQFPAMDASVELISAQCSPQGLEVQYKVVNQGDGLPLPADFRVGIFDKNPMVGPANLLNVNILGSVVSPLDSSVVFTVNIPITTESGTFYLLANVPATGNPPFSAPAWPTSECNYTNNLTPVPFNFPQSKPDLGPDRKVCEHQAVVLAAGAGFERYQWSNGSADSATTVFEPGWHWVKTTDACGRTQADSVLITVDPGTVVELGADRILCLGDTVQLASNLPAATHQWFPASLITCPGCSTIQLTPTQSVTVSVLVSNTQGCYSTDSLRLTVLPAAVQQTSAVSLCEGDSIRLGGQWVSTAGAHIYQNSQLPCDTIFTANISLLDTQQVSLAYILCPGDVIQVAGQALSVPGQYTFPLVNSAGCDSTVQVNITPAESADPPQLTVDCVAWNVSASVTLPPDWNVVWSNGATTAQTTYSPPGNGAALVLSDQGCAQTFSFQLPELPDTTAFPSLPDTLLPFGALFRPGLVLDSAEWRANWLPAGYFSCADCLNPTAQGPLDARVILLLEHRPTGCTFERMFNLRWITGEDLYVPNAISPEGSAENAVWEVFPQSSVQDFLEARVYDRWGEMVYAVTDSPVVRWDGRFNGQKAAPGVYVYWLRYRMQDGAVRFATGDLVVVR